MKVRKTDNQLFLEETDRTFRGKELALQIVGSGLGVLTLDEGTLIVFELSKVVNVVFQLKKTLRVAYLNDASYIDYLAGSVINLGTGKPKEFLEFAPQFKRCRLPTILELEQYEQFSTI